jgi:hypothetical protein
MSKQNRQAARRDYFVRLTDANGSQEDDGRDDGGEGIHLTEAEALRRATTPGYYLPTWTPEVIHWG